MSRAARETSLRRHLQRIMKRDVSDLGLDDDLQEALGIDSLSTLEVLASVEDEYDVTFDENDLSRFRTLRLILDALDGARPAVEVEARP